MFNLDIFIINLIRSVFNGISNNEVLALQSLKYLIMFGATGIGLSSFLEARNKVNKKR